MMTNMKSAPVDENGKIRELDPNRENFAAHAPHTTDQGIPIETTDDSLKVGPRGPTLLEDFHFREKLTRFDHERIPERVVHARGTGVHGYFQVYESLADLTKAKFLQDPSKKTPVFVRFSTVVGSRGSADTVRDVRGFATKFYTEEGNFDLVGNNIPVFFIQDGLKFPDVVHAVKPEPDSEMPQASSAHDTFWDFISLVPESMHMIMWHLSDRAIPRSYRMMEGFGVHTFRLVNAEGKSRFVKFHWKPLLGVHSFVWDEALKIAGKDPDFHRRDLWKAIEMGAYPEYELGLQIIEEDQADDFDFDLLDATKIVPEELVPVRRVGKLTLNRNPDNFFAETEQVAFCVQNVVPGIDFTDDPLMQARLFSYLDTQITRLGGPNFVQIPINRPVAQVANHQQDGFHQHRIPRGKVNYSPNSLGGGCPMAAGAAGFVHHPEQLSGPKVRQRSESFGDHYSQATLFWNSMSAPEKEHIVKAAVFELGKVAHKYIRERMVEHFTKVDGEFGRLVAVGLGLQAPAATGIGATVKHAAQSVAQTLSLKRVDKSPALSQENTPKPGIKTRRIAILAENGVSEAELSAVRAALMAAGAEVHVISTTMGALKTAEGTSVEVDFSSIHVGSILYDAVYVPGGEASVEAMKKMGDPIHFLNEAYRHHKPIGATSEGVELIVASQINGVTVASSAGAGKLYDEKGVVTVRGASDLTPFVQAFVAAITQHRHWDRPEYMTVPA
jgi:catalase